MKEELLHLFPEGAAVNAKGHLEIGGCDTVALAGEYGTPLYVLDESHIRNKCRQYVSEFTGRFADTRVAYASKACLNKAVARVIREEGLELDVVSGGELAIALSAGFPAARVYFHGNNKSPEEMRYAFENGVGYIVADNLMELEILQQLAFEFGYSPEVLIRVTPGVEAHTHQHITTGYTGSKFGLPLGDAAGAIKKARKLVNLKLVGLHCHLGSQINETRPYEEALGVLIDFSREVYDKEGFELKKLSIGGGFGVNYTLQDRALPVSVYADTIINTLTSACNRAGLSTPGLIIEPGRSIIGPAGVTLYRVGMIKEIQGLIKYVTVDGGMADNIRPALYDASYAAVAAGKMYEPASEKVTIAGKYCESGDILVKDVSLASVTMGDIVAIPVTGAYCLPMASNYNGAPKPAVVMVNGGGSRVICRREEYSDLVRLDVG